VEIFINILSVSASKSIDMTEFQKTRRESKKAGRKPAFSRRMLLIFICIAIVASIGVLALFNKKQGDSGPSNPSTGLFVVKRGDLTISVTESGSIKAVNTKDIKSEVEGRATIVSIVPEGTMITAEDVNNGKVLVELDSSELKEQLSQREIELTSAEASYADANESYLIQVKQNESDITAAELKMKFALMDLQKYIGEGIAKTVVERSASDPNSGLDTSFLLKDPNNLGGSASRQLKVLRNDILLAQGQLEKATDVLEGTQKLHDANYASDLDLMSAQLDVDRFRIQKESAEEALTLYQLYDFPKETEKFLSDYREAQRELDRTKARARAQLAQAKAKLASARSTFDTQKRRLNKLHEQIEACTIRAPAVGQVVYWSSTERWVRTKIEQGAEIPEGYKIITIPDASEMKVEVKIHETWIDRIEPNQPAEITVEAFPDKAFKGRVLKKAPLADAEDWLNPDLKVYATDIGIDGKHDYLKTGMTGKVTIIINKLQNVLYVPIQSVVTVEDKKVCYVAGSPAEKRNVETGLFNDNFVEIKSGLAEGEKVLLNPPKWTEPQKTQEQTETESEPAKEQPKV
jgi:HlyD family secretion protein